MTGPCAIRRASVEDAAGVARVHVHSWRTTYTGVVPDDFLDGLSFQSSEARWIRRLQQSPDSYAMFVAETDGGQIVGFADGGPERSGDPVYDGELYAIYLLHEYQRQGIGRRLFRHVVQHLVQHQFRAMLIWVLAENPARQFYVAMGGKPIRESDIDIGGKRLREVAYGWPELSKWLAQQERERP